jgi:hypothetical protein
MCCLFGKVFHFSRVASSASADVFQSHCIAKHIADAGGRHSLMGTRVRCLAISAQWVSLRPTHPLFVKGRSPQCVACRVDSIPLAHVARDMRKPEPALPSFALVMGPVLDADHLEVYSHFNAIRPSHVFRQLPRHRVQARRMERPDSEDLEVRVELRHGADMPLTPSPSSTCPDMEQVWTSRRVIGYVDLLGRI